MEPLSVTQHRESQGGKYLNSFLPSDNILSPIAQPKPEARETGSHYCGVCGPAFCTA